MIYNIVCLRNCRGARFNYYVGDKYTCRISSGSTELYGLTDEYGTFSGFMALDFIKRNFNIEEMEIIEELEDLFNTLMDKV